MPNHYYWLNRIYFRLGCGAPLASASCELNIASSATSIGAIVAVKSVPASNIVPGLKTLELSEVIRSGVEKITISAVCMVAAAQTSVWTQSASSKR